MIHLILNRGFLAVVLLASAARSGSAQSRFESVVATSPEVAHHVEHFRTPPQSIDLAGETVSPSGWMEVGVRAILNIAAIDTRGDAEPTWLMPSELYPEMILEDAAYGSVLDRAGYLDFLQDLATSYSEGAILPSTFERNGAGFRFVDVFFMVARLLRYYETFGHLPDFVDPKVATPRGLYAWEIPAGMETYLSAIQNENGGEYSSTFEYYKTSVLDFGLYQLARSIAGSESDPYVAGQRLFQWSLDRYNQSPYGVNFDVTNVTGFVDDSWEMIRNMHGTSGKPSRINSGLYVAAGLVHGYDSRGYGGALYTEAEGWYNAEIHARYGAPVFENQFFRFDGDPIPQDPSAIPIATGSAVIEELSALVGLDTETVPFRAFWVNPADVTTWGADAIVEAATQGGFRAVILTVKSFVGRLYFGSDAGANFGGDALRPLLDAAREDGIEIYAAFNTLGDFELDRAEEWGQRYLEPVFGYEYNEFFMSPCVSGYVDYLKALITGLYQNYEIDGLVLARNYVHSDGWANPECGLDDRATDRVKRDRIGVFANDLAGHAKSLNAARHVLYMTAPLLGNSGTALDGYSHDAMPNDLGSDNFDGVILSIHGLAWLTREKVGFPDPAQETRDGFIAEYLDLSPVPVHTMVHLSKDWVYAPAFYRGLARQYRSRGLHGVVLTSVNSAEGEFGPAFVEQHRAKLSRIRFEDPPPVREVITVTDGDTPVRHELIVGSPYPNPADAVVSFDLEIPVTARIGIRVFDLLGKTVQTIAERTFQPGRRRIEWRADGIAAGVYILRVDGPGGSASRRIALH